MTPVAKFDHAAQSEEGLIGALLIRPDLIPDASDEVDVSDIFSPSMSKIYAAMLTLWGRGVLADPYTLADEMRSTGELETIGGSSIFVSLMADAPRVDIASYVRVILDASLRRRLFTAAESVKELAGDHDVTGADALDQSRELLATIDAFGSVPSEVVDVGTFCEGVDTFDWLIENLIERGDRMLVVAAEASGKSMLLRQVAVNCAYGLHPFTLRPVEPCRVLLIDLENPPSLIRRKVRPIMVKARTLRPYGDPQMMGVVCKPGGIDVTKRADSRWLAGQLMAARPDLVVAGPLYKMFAADDKWEQGARAVTSILDDMRTRLGFALLLETHAPQGMAGGTRALRPIGSSLWLRWPEFGISFAPVDRHPETVKVTTWKARDERQWPHYMKRGGEMPWTPCGDPEGPKGRPEPTWEPPPPFEQEAF